MLKRLAATIAATALMLLSACGSQSTSNNTSPSSVVPSAPVTLKEQEDVGDLPVGTTVVIESGFLEGIDEDLTTICTWVGDSDPPTCVIRPFIALNVPFDEITWGVEWTEQHPQYRCVFANLTGTIVHPGVIDVSEIESLPWSEP
ncbi:hypothetical protein [Actinobaculum sp. 313]|uniref:hypothetical protein n=1 Tax=Actinobaculum sp. 313 TaxID=2495645 RepID=UPI000D526671|nr:hypothetical protein [Actinobaculum sp. 313]AWE41829.1 hypothetical protein DDD63_02590 [Actinobaculum sp. 313]